MTLIILQIGTNGTVQSWRTDNAISFINAAENHYGMVYETWDLERANRTFGKDQLPFDLKEILEIEGEVVEVNWGSEANNGLLFDVLSAPPKLEIAKQAVFHGMKEGFVLTLDEAQAFVNGDLDIVEDSECRVLAKRAVSIQVRIEAELAKKSNGGGGEV